MSFVQRYAAEVAEENPGDLVVPIMSPKLAGTVLAATVKAYPESELIVTSLADTDTYLVPVVVQVGGGFIILHVTNPTVAGGA